MSGIDQKKPEPLRSQNDFVSVDSAPRLFSGKVPIWKAPCVLLVFVLISGTLLWAFDANPFMRDQFPSGDLIVAPYSGSHSIPLRTFILSYMIAFGLFSLGKLSWRLGFLADMVVSYLVICAVIDVTALVFDSLLGFPMHLTVIEILSGLLGYAVYSFKLLERGNMPSRIEVTSSMTYQTKTIVRLIVVIILAAIMTIVIDANYRDGIQLVRQVALLGGIGPGVFLFLPLVFVLLYLIARYDTSVQANDAFEPPLAVIIPAHNEEYIIAQTVHSIDHAAKSYGGSVSILVMDNNSTDNTSKIATQALSECQHALGRVIPVPKPGKSHALNAAVTATQTEFVVRIDADTQIDANALHYAMLRMKDPKVGVVGGLPRPPGGGPFDRARFLELIVKHGFYSVGLSAVNSVVGVPGMFAAYRTELPRRLGGFVQGMNGEDTDMSLRIGELGYKLVVDPRIGFVSEVPATYHHMREQRMRWFRSVYHVSARCRDLIYSKRLTVRGKVLLPFMLLNSAMRSMMVPMILFGILVLALPVGVERNVPWQAVLAVLIGAPAGMSILCALLNRAPRALLYVPEYLIFRIIRAYFTLESNLSITLKGYGQHIYAPSAIARDENKEDRDA